MHARGIVRSVIQQHGAHMATLEQIQAKMKQLQAQADALISKKAQAVVDQIRALMLKHGLTTEDIEAKAKAKRAAKGLTVGTAAYKTNAATGEKAKVAPKYQHPKTGATWTGRGRAPAWIAEAKDRSRFLIAGGTEATVAASAGAVSKAKSTAKKASTASDATAHKGQRKGPQPAKYRDPKSGATWSGRGPAPAWLAGAKDRSKFLIDSAAALVATDATFISKAGKPKVAGRSSAGAKKAAAKKVVAKEAAATKSPTVKKVLAKKATMPSAKRTVAKKVVGKKAVAVKTVTAKADTTATPEISAEVGV